MKKPLVLLLAVLGFISTAAHAAEKGKDGVVVKQVFEKILLERAVRPFNEVRALVVQVIDEKNGVVCYSTITYAPNLGVTSDSGYPGTSISCVSVKH